MKKLGYCIARIYNDLLLIGVFERLASWDWPVFTSSYKGTST
jgi:hypothetical protein